mmetsp:Transcript_7932/g.25060  ORF Transcript_7932/g.25060 Transcript_7932/m.25060 type:complete len:272 (-) Transcript_7932:448-1263(-)
MRPRHCLQGLRVLLVLALLDLHPHGARGGLRLVLFLLLLDLLVLIAGGLGLLVQIEGLLVFREEPERVFQVQERLAPLVQSTQRRRAPHEGLEARVGALLEAVLEDLRVLDDLVAGADGVPPAEDLQLRQGLVRPQRLAVAPVLQALVVVLDRADVVALLQALVSSLAAPLRRVRLLGRLLLALLQVRLHGQELGVVPGHDGLALFLRVGVRLPVLPGLVVDVPAPAQQGLGLLPAQPLVLAPLVLGLLLLEHLQLAHELVPAGLLRHHLV